MSDEISTYELHLCHGASRERAGKSEAEKDSVWIKLNVAFREEFLAKLKGPRLSVFLCLALHINEQFKARPSIARISQETGYERKAVMRAVRWLEAEGLLKVERSKPGPRQRGRRANRYKVLHFAAYGKKHCPSKGPGSTDDGPYTGVDHGPSERQITVPLEGHEEEQLKKNHQHQPMTDYLIGLLCSFRFKKEAAYKLTQKYPHKMIESTCEVAKEKDLRNPAGWIVTVLANGGAEPTGFDYQFDHQGEMQEHFWTD